MLLDGPFGWQRKHKLTAYPLHTILHPDPATMRVNRQAAERQPQTKPARARLITGYLHEAIEEPLALIGWNAAPGVGYTNLYVIVAQFHR